MLGLTQDQMRRSISVLFLYIQPKCKNSTFSLLIPENKPPKKGCSLLYTIRCVLTPQSHFLITKTTQHSLTYPCQKKNPFQRNILAV